ncbi:FMN-binding protein [Sulfuricystis multivorans]|uniref:FMN-binding protein n=1 Tax=Sulfuricystis multivorans TaxID=2211108 RepID=UPI0024E016FC|nr:FMN-binding protein [Sulfuricystis multivorans]
MSQTLPQMTPPAAMIRTLGLIAAICGTIIVAAYQGTYGAVQENKRIAVERGVFRVIPTAKSIVEYIALPTGTVEKVGGFGTAPSAGAGGTAPAGAIRFFAGYDEAGRLVGIAAEGAAKGYADNVRILFAWEPTSRKITGFGVVAARETPGIGDKVSKDRDFLANFPLAAEVAEDGKALAHEIRTVKHGTKTHPWEIDAIAGATITSRAVGRAINDTAQALLPRIAPHLDQLKEKP